MSSKKANSQDWQETEKINHVLDTEYNFDNN